MRALPALALTLSAFALSGCTADASGPFHHAAQDCSSATDSAVERTEGVLLPGAAPSEHPQVRVHARQGQILAATATWNANAGEAQVAFDGPSQHEVQAGTTWSSTTLSAPEGDYTLRLEGAPFAQGVSYTLVLVATGCTPAA